MTRNCLHHTCCAPYSSAASRVNCGNTGITTTAQAATPREVAPLVDRVPTAGRVRAALPSGGHLGRGGVSRESPAVPGRFTLRLAAKAGRPARPARGYLRRLRRAAGNPHLHGLRHRRQALRAKPLCPMQSAAAHHSTAHRGRRPSPDPAGVAARGDLCGPQPEIGAELAGP